MSDSSTAHQYYWSGIAAIVPLCWLCWASFAPIRKWSPAFFRYTHYISAILFSAFFYLHCNNVSGCLKIGPHSIDPEPLFTSCRFSTAGTHDSHDCTTVIAHTTLVRAESLIDLTHPQGIPLCRCRRLLRLSRRALVPSCHSQWPQGLACYCRAPRRRCGARYGSGKRQEVGGRPAFLRQLLQAPCF